MVTFIGGRGLRNFIQDRNKESLRREVLLIAAITYIMLLF